MRATATTTIHQRKRHHMHRHHAADAAQLRVCPCRIYTKFSTTLVPTVLGEEWAYWLLGLFGIHHSQHLYLNQYFSHNNYMLVFTTITSFLDDLLYREHVENGRRTDVCN